MTGISTITSKGQATIPMSLRRLLDLQAGDKLYFEADQDKKTVKITKMSSWVDRLAGSLKTTKPYIPIEIARQKAGELLGKKYSLMPK